VFVPVLGYLRSRSVVIFHSADTNSYVLPAQELIANHRFFSQGAPEVIRTPGYPLFLTLGLLLGRHELVTVLIQTMISCFTVYMVYRTAHLIFKSERTSITAAALYAIEPMSILYTSQLLSETLFAALVVTWVYLLLLYLERRRVQYLCASATALAISTYVRPIGYLLPFILAATLSASIVATVHARKRLLVAQTAAFLGVYIALTSAWQVRNEIQVGYAGFSGISRFNKYFYLAASTLARQQRVRFDVMQRTLGYLDDRLYLQLHPEQKKWTQGQRLNYMNDEANYCFAEQRTSLRQDPRRGYDASTV
jgi:4-amino-4-deoxy-L-arabinose transferase-like glycosyltransferase